MREQTYQRLPGRGRGGMGGFGALSPVFSRLYLGPDHLLRVDSTGITESYRRFFFDDIQGFLIRKTARATGWNIAMAVILAGLVLGLSISLKPPTNQGWAIFWAIAAGFQTVMLLVNLGRGPTCITTVFTAVSREELPSLQRVRAARKALARIRPKIIERQGALAPETYDLTGRPPEPASPGRFPAASPSASYRAWAHYLLFATLLIGGGLALLDIPFNSVAITAASAVVGLSAMALAIIALVISSRAEVRGALAGVTWGAVGYLGARMLAGYVMMVIVAIRHVGEVNDQWTQIRHMSEMSATDSLPLLIMLIVSAVCAFGLAIPGLILTTIAGRGYPQKPEA